ncbi:hypothetical protein BVC80_949g85 [Macleaya cordata]|uniref:Methyltransferase type 12 domain-containing protein n=1 Tax=Macleaya cordata TaxID=56857 RepID=A0A200QX92_MACCD|nr:hypothetical protein BVC80_949g85 [Macleaya cordata]
MATSKGVVVSVPVLVASVAASAIFFFFFLTPFLSSSSTTCNCPTTSSATITTTTTATSSYQSYKRSNNQISPTQEDINWWKDQIQQNQLQDYIEARNKLRKGINPRTRAQQLQDLIQFKGISHYEGPDSSNHTALPCPGELLVEEHHSNYGEPWAGGRDVFEFLAESARLNPGSRVLEIGCGTLRVGLHFIRYLNSQNFHCLERDELSLIAAFRYELPSQGLLHKRPLIVKGEDMDFSKFGSEVVYDLIYASAVFLHMPDNLVWTGLERLSSKLKPFDGRIFVSHNIKFCSRLGGEECTKRLTNLGLEYIGKHTHDSLLFNHYEIWFEFRRSMA